MKYTFVFVLLYVVGIIGQIRAQGCVAIRGTAQSACVLGAEADHAGESWQLNVGYRYFKSFRHFSGKEEHENRLIENTEVINYQSALDLSLIKNINSHWSLMIDIPILANKRSSLYEHGLVNGAYVKRERDEMSSFGIGDIRIAAYRWLWDPMLAPKGNIQVGLGLKLPTGEYDYMDFWSNVGPEGSRELRTVDQSIQLGDGGTGITLELNGHVNLSNTMALYSNFYYLANPREHNGARTYRETLVARLANEAIMSVPDQYMFRAGGNASFGPERQWSVGAGMRLEGIPVYDLIGGSGEFRRPGYVWSIEPSLSYATPTGSIFLSVPVATVRNRTQSVTDKENSERLGMHVQGDAAFADYLINIGFSHRFGISTQHMMPQTYGEWEEAH